MTEVKAVFQNGCGMSMIFLSKYFLQYFNYYNFTIHEIVIRS